jgi:hypothetical protein
MVGKSDFKYSDSIERIMASAFMASIKTHNFLS